MYETFYGFQEKPFSLLPDPAFIYMSKKHRMAFSMLEYGLMNQAGFTVITGEIGAGKTTLIRMIMEQIDLEYDVIVGLVSNAHRSFGELLQWVLLAFKLDFRSKDKVELYHTLTDYLIKMYEQGNRTVLIIDEAQNLSMEALEELRMLSNINSDKNQILQLVLVGQPDLRDMLRAPELQQFAQRIAVDFHLKALNMRETCEYIRHRLHIAGGDPNLFETAACISIFYYTRGTPRLINVLCDTALVCGFAEQRSRIDADLVHDVVRDKTIGGIVPVWERDDASDPVMVDLYSKKLKGKST